MTIRRNPSSPHDTPINSIGDRLRTTLDNMGMSIEDHEPAPSHASAAVKAWIAFRDRPSPSRERVAKHAIAALERYFEADLIAFAKTEKIAQAKPWPPRVSIASEQAHVRPRASVATHSPSAVATRRAEDGAVLAIISSLRERIRVAAILAHELPKDGTFATLMSRAGKLVPHGPLAAALRSWSQLADEQSSYKVPDTAWHVRELERFALAEDDRLRRYRAGAVASGDGVTMVFAFGECERDGDLSNYVRQVEDLGLVVVGRSINEDTESCRVKAVAPDMARAQHIMKMYRSGEIDFCDNLRVVTT